MSPAAGVLDRDDLVEHPLVVAGEEGAAVDDHVDLVGPGCNGVACIEELHGEAGSSARKGGCDGGDVHAVADHCPRCCHEIAVDADRCDGGSGWIGRVGSQGLRAHRPDLAGGVHALEGGEVDHADREVDRPGLRRGLDRPRAEGCRAAGGPDLVDPGQAVEELAQ